ncbi:MAG: MBOAT family protein [Bacteroidales bacterium]|nr:MBOAT family protein [Bacteroidales bacterium]
MVFNSAFFLFYFLPAFLIIYYLIPSAWRNYWTLLCSLIFYAWGAPKFVFILIAVTIANFYIIRIMHSGTEKAQKYWLVFSIILNISLLLVFKYTNFFFSNINILLTKLRTGTISWHEIALPIGISFCVFHAISYSIDVYRKTCPPCERLSDYMMYIFLFPKLLSGPIIRFNTINHDIRDRKSNETISNVFKGLIRFSIGLGKKVLLANVLGYYANLIYNAPSDTYDSLSIVLGNIAFSFQIYFDFAGYSDMAIGLGKMIGFNFPENFIAPYISKNITEFWRRWHITLMTFMRDYLYLPLCTSGKRIKTKFDLLFNLWLVFLISGFWHGSNWTFIVWGAYHGSFLILDRLFYKKWSDKRGILSVIINYVILFFSWIIFRSDNIQFIGGIIEGIFRFTASTSTEFFTTKFWIILGCGIFFSFSPFNKTVMKNVEKIHDVSYSFKGILILSGASLILLIISLSSVITSGFNPFIYFRF